MGGREAWEWRWNFRCLLTVWPWHLTHLRSSLLVQNPMGPGSTPKKHRVGGMLKMDGICVQIADSCCCTAETSYVCTAMTNLDSILKSRDITLPTKVCIVEAMVFPVVMYGCESWTIKKAECRRIDAFELWCWRRFLSPLDCNEIKPVNPKGNQSWIFTGRTDAKVEAPILWPPDSKNWFIGKDPDAGKDWRWEKGTTEDEIVGWHHWLNGHESEQTPGVGDGQGGLAFCSPWDRRVGHDWAIELNWQQKRIQYCKAIILQLKIF